MTDTIRMLLYSDGSTQANQALELGKQIALAVASAVDILAISRRTGQKEAIERVIEAAAEELRAADVAVTVYERPGLVAEEVIAQACLAPYDLVVIGSRGRRGIQRLVAGSRACTVIERTPTSILVVKGRRRRDIEQILVCSAAGPASEPTVRFAAQLAHALGASITLLHVMSQVALEENARAADLEAEAEELIEAHTREGEHLDHMRALLDEEGVKAHAIVRHGLVTEEILAEAQEGHFDMLVIGAHTTPGIRSLLVDNLSKEITLSANRPVLVVQQD